MHCGKSLCKSWGNLRTSWMTWVRWRFPLVVLADAKSCKKKKSRRCMCMLLCFTSPAFCYVLQMPQSIWFSHGDETKTLLWLSPVTWRAMLSLVLPRWEPIHSSPPHSIRCTSWTMQRLACPWKGDRLRLSLNFKNRSNSSETSTTKTSSSRTGLASS